MTTLILLSSAAYAHPGHLGDPLTTEAVLYLAGYVSLLFSTTLFGRRKPKP